MLLQNLLVKCKAGFSVSRTLYWINWILVGSFVWLCGSAASSVLEHQFLDVPRTRRTFVPPERVRPDTARPYGNFGKIVDLNVFDAEVTAEIVVEEKVVETPASAQLEEILSKLTLLGIYRGKRQYSVIKDNKTRKEDIFETDDEVFQTGAFVEKIQIADGVQAVYVRFNNEIGVLEKLESKEDKKVGGIGRTVAANKKAPSLGGRAPSGGADTAPAKSTYSSNGKDFFLRTVEVQKHINNFTTLLNQAKVVPYMENGKNVGYTIKNITKGSLYEKLGLKNFDIIRHVNGNAIDSMEKAIELFHTLKNEREITINIVRNKKPLSFNYHIN